MSWSALAVAAAATDLTPSEKLVLLAVAYNADDNGVMFRSQRLLAEWTGHSTRGAVGANLASLVSKGWLDGEQAYNTRDGGKTVKVYRVASVPVPPNTRTVRDDLTGKVSKGILVAYDALMNRATHVRLSSNPPSIIEQPSPDNQATRLNQEIKSVEKEAALQKELSDSEKLDIALGSPSSAESRAFLAEKGLAPDSRGLFRLQSFINQMMGRENGSHAQVQASLPNWIGVHTPKDLRAAWERAKERQRLSPVKGLRPVHHFVDILNGTYKPSPAEIEAEAAERRSAQVAASKAWPSVGSRVKRADGAVVTVKRVEKDGWLMFVEDDFDAHADAVVVVAGE